MLRGGRRSLRRGRRRRGRQWTAVAGLTVLATSGTALSADAAPSPASINGCYLPLANPAQLYVATKAGRQFQPPTQMGEGKLNAVLIGSSKGTSAAAQPASRKLTIVRPWYSSVS